MVLEKKIFQFCQCILLFRNNLPLGKGGSYIWTSLSLHHPRMLWTKFGWNWSCGSLEDLFFVYVFYYRYLPLEKDWVLYLNKLKSPSPKDATTTTTTTTTTTDNGQILFRKALLSLQLRWAKIQYQRERECTDRDGLSRSKPSIFITYVLLKKE